MKTFQTEFHPRFSDFDLQGILSSRQYVELVGEARVQQLRDNYHYPIEKFIEKRQSFVLSDFTIKFISPIHYPESFFIETAVAEMEGPRSKVEFSFIGKDKSVRAKGTVTYFLFDMKGRRPVDFTPEEKAIFL